MLRCSQPNRFSRFLSILVILALAFILGLFGTTLAQKPQPGGTYRGSISPLGSLDPHSGHLPQAYAVTGNIYNTLLRFNQDMSALEPDLAESWKRVDDLTYVFKLRPGVRFQNVPPVNGRECTSADVKYSIERVTGLHGNKEKFTNRTFFEDKLAAIETPDPLTVVFKTKEPYAAFVHYLAYNKCPIVPKEAVDAFGDLKNKAIGTGPFLLAEHVQGSHITLTRNPNYFKPGMPYLDKIHLKIISDSSATMAAFLAGRLDVMGAYFFQVRTIQKKAPEARVIQRKGSYLWTLRMRPWIEGKQPLKAPFDKVGVRRAVAMSIDKQKLLKLSVGGYGDVQVCIVPNWPPYSLPESDQVEYNPEKAKKLLAEAGYPDGFSTELVTWNASYMMKPAQVITEMLNEVGIKARLRTMEQPAYFNFVYTFDWDMTLHTSTMGPDPENCLMPYFGPLDKATFYKWSNPAIWKIVEEQSKTVDEDKRVQLIQKAQRMILADSPMVWLYTMSGFTILRPYVHRDLYFNELQSLVGESIWMDKH